MPGIPPTKRGYDFGECSSAMQKSIRRGDEEGALYWGIELDRSGYGEYVWRRLRLMTSEDIGLADPLVPIAVRALYDNWVDARRKRDDRQESWRLFLVHALILMARAKKSRIVDHALIYYYSDRVPKREVPDVAQDKHTVAGKRQGRGWPHFWDEGTLLIDHNTGELNHEPVLADPYREKAISATTRRVTNGSR